MIVLLICRAVTADHGPAVVTGAFYKKGGYGGTSRPHQTHEHSDAPVFVCELVRAVDESIASNYPHRMRNGSAVVDGDAYLAHCARYIP